MFAHLHNSNLALSPFQPSMAGYVTVNQSSANSWEASCRKRKSSVEKSILDHLVIDLTRYILYVVHFKDKLVSKLFVKLFLKFGRDSKLIHCLRL